MIDLSKDMCCDTNIFRGLGSLGFDCCGNTVYDPKGSDLCCDTVLYLNAADGDNECCGTELCTEGSTTEPPEPPAPPGPLGPPPPVGGITDTEPEYGEYHKTT